MGGLRQEACGYLANGICPVFCLNVFLIKQNGNNCNVTFFDYRFQTAVSVWTVLGESLTDHFP